MNQASERLGERFVQQYLDPEQDLSIIDIGSYDVNGTFKPYFDKPKWKYFGVDIAAGPNVDKVLEDPYNWDIKEKFDVVISGSTIEHVPDMKRWILEIPKIIKPKGLVVIQAPFSHGEHRHPVDCWRIVRDGMEWLLKEICGFEILENYYEGQDCVGIARNTNGTY